MLWHHKAWSYSFYSFPSNNVVTVQILIVLILFFLIKQCCHTTKLDCAHFISSHQIILWHHKAWLYLFYFSSKTTLWHHRSSVYSLYFFPSNKNNAVTPQSLIVLMLFLTIKQRCDTTQLDCTYYISSHQTLLWHYKAWLYSCYFFLSHNAVTPQSKQFYNLWHRSPKSSITLHITNSGFYYKAWVTSTKHNFL